MLMVNQILHFVPVISGTFGNVRCILSNEPLNLVTACSGIRYSILEIAPMIAFILFKFCGLNTSVPKVSVTSPAKLLGFSPTGLLETHYLLLKIF